MPVRRAATALTLAMAALAATAGSAFAGTRDTALVSRASALGAAGNDSSEHAAISADGRFVAFTSVATNLPDDADANPDVFVHDRLTGVTTLASRATGADGVSADGEASEPSISADGRYVAFRSNSPNLGASGSQPLIFVRDLVADTTTVASPSRDSSEPGDAAPAISADGGTIAFTSPADSLSADDTDSTTDVFVVEAGSSTAVLASRATGDDGAGADAGGNTPSISADGSRVAFVSNANNLADSDADGNNDIFVRDLATDTTRFVSRPRAGQTAQAGRGSGDPDISANGRFVSFESRQNGLQVATDPDGGFNTDDVFVHDLDEDVTNLESRVPNGPAGNSDSFASTVSADGRYVAFSSDATNLDDLDHFGTFVRDRVANITTRVSRASGPTGEDADAFSNYPDIAASAPFVVFEVEATNLDPAATDGTSQIYIRQFADLPGQPGGGNPPPGGTGYPLPTVTPDVVAPRLTRLSLLRRRFAVGRAATPRVAQSRRRVKRGTRLRLTLNERSTVRIAVEQRTTGRRARGRCRKRTRKNRARKRCVRYVKRGTLVRRKLAAGRRSIAFSGRIGRKKLKPGRYRFVIVAVDAAGNRSARRRANFRILRG